MKSTTQDCPGHSGTRVGNTEEDQGRERSDSRTEKEGERTLGRDDAAEAPDPEANEKFSLGTKTETRIAIPPPSGPTEALGGQGCERRTAAVDAGAFPHLECVFESASRSLISA